MANFRTSQPVSVADPALPHIVLVGLPGSGKTTVGDLLAKKLGRNFLDFDHEITRRESATVAEIFATKGEHHFRTMERELTAELRGFGNMVLSPGGGWVADPDNLATLRPPAVLVYLKTTPATAIKRMGSKAAGRPLLMRPNPVGELERMLAARKAAYETADFVVDVERLDPQRVTDKIAALLAGSAGLKAPHITTSG